MFAQNILKTALQSHNHFYWSGKYATVSTQSTGAHSARSQTSIFGASPVTKLGFTTRQVHSDRMLNTPEHGGVHSSTSNSVLFEFKDAQGIIDAFQGKRAAHVYSRSSSPSVAALQNMLNDLEGGVGTLCYSTGMAAISSSLFALLKAGDHLIVSQYLFGNTRSFWNH